MNELDRLGEALRDKSSAAPRQEAKQAAIAAAMQAFDAKSARASQGSWVVDRLIRAARAASETMTGKRSMQNDPCPRRRRQPARADARRDDGGQPAEHAFDFAAGADGGGRRATAGDGPHRRGEGRRRPAAPSCRWRSRRRPCRRGRTPTRLAPCWRMRRRRRRRAARQHRSPRQDAGDDSKRGGRQVRGRPDGRLGRAAGRRRRPERADAGSVGGSAADGLGRPAGAARLSRPGPRPVRDDRDQSAEGDGGGAGLHLLDRRRHRLLFLHARLAVQRRAAAGRCGAGRGADQLFSLRLSGARDARGAVHVDRHGDADAVEPGDEARAHRHQGLRDRRRPSGPRPTSSS